MPVRIVQSKQNARLKELRRVLAQPGRDAARVAGIEGPHLVAEAVRAGLKLVCVFLGEGSEKLLDELSLPADLEILCLPRDVLAGVLTTESPQPLAALVETRKFAWSDLTAPRGGTTPLVLLLAGIQDPGNFGTIVRSAEAFGATGVVALPGTVSAWNPKALRASAGSAFRVPILTATASEALTALRSAGVHILSTAAQSAKPAPAIDLKQPTALLIGNEGSGVPKELAFLADGVISVPCPGPVESLNAAVAASVLLYEASRQRAGATPSRNSKRGAR